MNKYFFLIIQILLGLELSQAQIINGSFEFWEEVLNYERPIGWSTNQDTNYTRIEKDTIAIDGNYSLKLMPTTTSSWQGCTSWAVTHVEFDSALPYNSVLTFYLKSVPEDPNEDNSVYFIIFGHTLKSDSVISTYDWRIFTPVEEFTRIEIPLPGENIDGLNIFIYGGASSDPLDGPCLGRSNSWVDGMTIDLGTPVGSFFSQEENDIIVYPNPSMGVVNIMARDEGNIGYELYSLIGELIDKGKIDNNQLNIHDQGVYILKLYVGLDDRNIYTSKLIIIN